MSAPNGTQWGAVNGGGTRQDRIGIHVSMSHTQTTTKVTIQIWYWTRYAVKDSSNTFYYDWDSYANASLGSKNINHTNNSGQGWNVANQTHIGTFTKSYNRGTSNYNGQASARYTGIDYVGGSGTCAVTFSIPARNRYSVTYNANGGSGQPATQYYYYGYDINLSTTIPKRDGYKFLGWSTNKSAISPSYSAGQRWSGTNGNTTLYAVWQRIIYEVQYNAHLNGGFVNGSESIYVKVPHGNTLGSVSGNVLPFAERENYKFLGWNERADGAGSYVDINTKIYKNVTFYAIYELQANCYVKQNGVNKAGMMYVKQNGTYKTGVVYVKQNGTYKQSEM